MYHLCIVLLHFAQKKSGALDTTLCDKLSVTGDRFSLSTLLSSTSKTDHHNCIAEILLNVVLSTITWTQKKSSFYIEINN